MIRRQIKVGNRVVIASVCGICPNHLAIWPESAMVSHIQRHDLMQSQAQDPTEQITARPVVRYRGGRTRGSRNHSHINGSGIEKRVAIRAR